MRLQNQNPQNQKQNQRLRKLKQLQNNIEDCPIFVTNNFDLFYLINFTGSFGALIVEKSDFLFITDSRYYEQYKEPLGNENIHKIKDSSVFISDIADYLKKKNINKISTDFTKISLETYNLLISAMPKLKVYDTKIISELRTIKDYLEINKIKKAIQKAEEAFYYILKYIKEGYTERSIAIEMEHYIKLKGSEDIAFDLLIQGGKNSSMPHYKAGEKKIFKDMPILLDFGALYGYYNSDMTRTVYFGNFASDFKEVYDIVLNAQEKAIKAIRPGVKASEIDAVARNYITESGYGDFFGHGLGHGIGIEVHENPKINRQSDTILQKGMVFSVEPGIYLPKKFGVRIEDLVLVTENGCEVLSSMPKENILQVF